MNKLEVIKFLLEEVEREKKRFADYREAHKQAEKYAKEHVGTDEWVVRYHRLHELYTDKIPRKSVIEQNMRKIRLLALDVIKEAGK